jgi:DNA-binding NtrC family response regulator
MSSCAILVVDDEEELRELIRHVLERAGHSVACASNGLEASLVIARCQFDVVVTDMLMPDRDGLELISEIKAKHPALKIVAMSGGGQIGSDQYLSMAKGFGAHVLLRKPFAHQALLAAVERARVGPN